MTLPSEKGLPTGTLQPHRSSDKHLHDRLLRPVMPAGSVKAGPLVLRRETLVAPEAGPGRSEAVRAPSAVPGTAALNARQVSGARPAAVRALVDLVAAAVSAGLPEVAGDSAEEPAEEEPAGAADNMKITLCNHYCKMIWRNK